LWNLDLAFAEVVSTSSDPALGAIRLAWWRERLEALDDGRAPAEPRLQAVADQLVPREVTGTALSQLEDAWLPLLEPFPWGEPAAEGLKLRGRILFGMGARLLGGDPGAVEAPGALWSLVDGARHCSVPQSRDFLVDQAHAELAGIRSRVARELRPLTVLAALAAADLAGKRSGIGRLSAAVRHRLLGTFPRS
jgi:15-cis-phytoene synthase